MIRAYVPNFKLIETDGGRNYYIYIIEVCCSGKAHKIEKRYSAFHRLYKEIQKTFITGDFPPKRVRNTSSKVLELRRSGLEIWLQSILRIQPIPQSVIHFLEVTNYQPSLDESIVQEDEDEGIIHQPFLSYKKDPFLFEIDQENYGSYEHYCSMRSPPLPDNVIKGVLMALHHRTLD